MIQLILSFAGGLNFKGARFKFSSKDHKGKLVCLIPQSLRANYLDEGLNLQGNSQSCVGSCFSLDLFSKVPFHGLKLSFS